MSDKKKKILYIITQGSWGGAQRYVYDLVTELADDFDITVAIGEPKGNRDLQKKLQITNYKLQIIQLKHLVRCISPIHDLLSIFELRKLYKTLKPNIIHLNSSKAGIIGSLAKTFMISDLGFRICVIYTAHGWIFNEPLSHLKKQLYLFLEKFTARWKNKIIALSGQDKQTAANLLGIGEEKLSLIPLGIETNGKQLTKEEAKNKIVKLSNCQTDNNTKLIGIIAGLYKTKGIDILIEAIAAINNKQSTINNSQFIIIGDGPEKRNLQLLITNYQLPNIHLLGFLDNANQYLPAFDLFVLPSRKEGLPYAILEAMNAKIPVLAAQVGGVPSLIEDEKTGFLVQSESAQKLADKIIDVLDNADLMSACAENAFRQTTQKNQLPQMLSTTEKLYRSFID